MSITVELSSEEIAQMTRLTNLQDGPQAVAHAAREFLRICRLRELSAMSGHVDYDDNWQRLESLEVAASPPNSPHAIRGSAGSASRFV